MNKKEILNIPFITNEKISNITTYKTEGYVKGVFYPQDEKQLILIYNFLTDLGLPFKVIGNGSNLLIKDNCGFLFICTKKMKNKIKIINNEVYLSSSVNLAKAFNSCYKKGLSGFERLAGIPATIGGALKMNASAFGSAIMDIVDKIKVIQNGKEKYIKKEDIIYSHHKSNLNDCLIISAKFKLKEANSCEILNEFGKFAKKRGEKQPKGFSCGSVFRNPENQSAGKLIEDCQLKGLKQNDAQISEKHGNFIVNLKNACFEDIKSLIEICEKEVKKQHNINLEREVEIIE